LAVSSVDFPGLNTYLRHGMSTEALVAKLQMLPPSAQRQVEVLVETLFAASQTQPKPQEGKRFKFDWEGGLEDLKSQFTAVELQHHINTLR
jgi:hypothetical protein